MARGEVRSVVVRERGEMRHCCRAQRRPRARVLLTQRRRGVGKCCSQRRARGKSEPRGHGSRGGEGGGNQRRQDMYLSCGSIDRSIDRSLLRGSSDDVAFTRLASGFAEPLEPPRRLVVGELPPPRPPPPASRHTTRHTHATRETTEISRQRRALDTPSPGNAALRSLLTPHGLLSMQQQQGGGGGGGGGGGAAPVVAVQTVDCSAACADVANRDYGRCVGAENHRCRINRSSCPPPSLSLGVVRSLETDPMHKHERRDDETDGATGATTTTSTARAPRAPAPPPPFRASSDARRT